MTCTECKKNYCTGVSEIASYLLWKSIFFKDSTSPAVPLVVEFLENIDFQRRYDAFSETQEESLKIQTARDESLLTPELSKWLGRRHCNLFNSSPWNIDFQRRYDAFSETPVQYFFLHSVYLFNIIWSKFNYNYNMNELLHRERSLFKFPPPRQKLGGGPRNFTKTPLFRVEIYLDPPF